jgi:kynureninase
MTKDNIIDTLDHANAMDRDDPLSSYREQFHIPQVNGVDSIYMTGNSLGLQPKKAREYVLQELHDWAEYGVEGHMRARHPWLPYHEFLTENMAAVVGALPGEIVVMNSLTVNVHLMLVSFYRPEGKKRKIVVESDLFPSDLYAVRSQIAFHGGDPDEDLILWSPREGEYAVQYDDLEDIVSTQRDEIALIFIGGVNYYTGQLFDLKRITALGHDNDIIVGFDLAHGAGNIDFQLHDSGADFAAWCSYKYLNSGPGSLASIFVHERHKEAFDLPRFTGWWGHNKETRFGMRDPFDPLPGAEGWQLSNPPILPMAVMRASLELFQEAGMTALRNKSKGLTSYMLGLIKKRDLVGLTIITPEEQDARGCQLSLFVQSNGKQVFDFLTENGVIADWREPGVIRVAPVPLYNTYTDVWNFINLLEEGIRKNTSR